MTSRMHLKNGRSARDGSYAQTGTTSSVMEARRPKVSVYQTAERVPEIIDSSLQYVLYFSSKEHIP
jgi:hypothetical protein